MFLSLTFFKVLMTDLVSLLVAIGLESNLVDWEAVVSLR